MNIHAHNVMLAAIALSAAFITADTSSAAIIAFQDGVNPTGAYIGNDVTYVRSDLIGTNHTNAAMLVGTNTSGPDFHGLLSFDISAIPAGSVINSVSLTLWQNADGGSSASVLQVDLHALDKAFVDSQTTWNNYSTGNAWTTPGGDYSPTILSSISASAQTGGVFRTFSSSVSFASAAQTALDSSQTLSLLLKLNDESGIVRNLFLFASDDATTSGTRPFLNVNYTAAIPEPSTAGLMLGGLGLLVAAGTRVRRAGRTTD